MATPTPEETKGVNEAVQTPAPVTQSPVQTAATSIVADVQNAETAFKDAHQVVPDIQKDLAGIPVLAGEPALILGTLVAVIIAILALTGVIDVSTAVGFVASAGPLVTGIITRFFVSPTTK